MRRTNLDTVTGPALVALMFFGLVVCLRAAAIL